MDKLNLDKQKKNKYGKTLVLFYKKITDMTNHIEYLFKNKYIEQDFYVEKMYIFNEIHYKVSVLESNINQKKMNKKFIEGYINDINELFSSVCVHVGSKSIRSVLSIFLIDNDFIDNTSNKFRVLFDIYNDYFIPFSVNVITDVKDFLIENEIIDLEIPNVINNSNNYLKRRKFIEKIDGANIVIYVNDKKILCINGIFKKDPLGIFKKVSKFREKNKEIESETEYLNLPEEFKEKYLEQLSLRDFIIMNPDQIVLAMKYDFDDFNKYKGKSLSSLVKEFIKMSPEKQRKLIILFLISDSESQFTAHIIYDLIIDQSFLYENEKLSDVLFNSLHWKIQKIFKISQSNFENNKKKLENINSNDIPYESKIMSLKTEDNVKSKAIEKLKEINGSKENSIKAQQWLDGFLKIPFGIYYKENIINFFGDFQVKMDKYIEIFMIKISEFDINILNYRNQKIYNDIIEIVNEYHSNVVKSENSYNDFILFLRGIKNNVKYEISSIYDNYDDKDESNEIKSNNEIVNDEMNEKNNLLKIKKELSNLDMSNTEDLKGIINKLDNLEGILNTGIDDKALDYDSNYNKQFNKFVIKNLDEFDNFTIEWFCFKNKKKDYMVNVDKILDQCTYGQNEAKNQMKRIIGQWMNGNSKGQCIGLCGPPGVGKTTLCKNGLAKCLLDDDGKSRPFAFLPLGGATNGSILEGHHYTYLGSTWGKIVDILIESRCMNPIIYVDELDKISNTEHGREIISILTHITDQSQNKEFYDRYFASVPIDLSQVLFIFSYNHRQNIDRILIDRIQEINIEPLSNQEKLIISKNYILPQIYKDIGFHDNEIELGNELINDVVNEYTHEAGVRKLNEILYDILREINLKKIYGNIFEYPYKIDKSFIDEVMCNKPKLTIKTINDKPKVGLVNGLYATASGLGGITIIQAKRLISEKKFGLEKLTGSQGDVMKESMECAFTLASNLLNDEDRNKYESSDMKFGVHIHCPEAATPKDGPSAGLAITTCLVSLLLKIPIRNDVAMTGEVDLEGKAREIGGLYSKIQGALNAEVKKVLIPKSNEKDLDVIFRKEESEKKNIKKSTSIKKMDSFLLLENKCWKLEDNRRIFRNKLEIVIVEDIYDILEHALVDNKYKFNREL